jgi:hypothetical protein
MDPALAIRLLDEIAEKNLCGWINLSLMGEPLLHPQFFTVAEHGVRLGLAIHVITNLSLLTPETLRRLLDLPVAHLALSLQTPGQESFQLKETSNRFSLEKSIQAVEQAVRIKLERDSPTQVSIHLLTTRLERPRGLRLLEGTRERLTLTENFRERARSWAKDHGLPDPPRPRFREPLSFWLGLDAFVPLLPGVNLCFKRATLWANTLLTEGAEVEPRQEGTCQLALDTLGILWDGRLTLCCLDFDGLLSLGNVSYAGIEAVLRSPGYRELRTAFAQGRLEHAFCQKCRGKVKGPWARELVPGSFPALIGEGWRYLGRFRFRRTLRRLPQELARYLGR